MVLPRVRIHQSCTHRQTRPRSTYHHIAHFQATLKLAASAFISASIKLGWHAWKHWFVEEQRQVATNAVAMQKSKMLSCSRFWVHWKQSHVARANALMQLQVHPSLCEKPYLTQNCSQTEYYEYKQYGNSKHSCDAGRGERVRCEVGGGIQTYCKRVCCFRYPSLLTWRVKDLLKLNLSLPHR